MVLLLALLIFAAIPALAWVAAVALDRSAVGEPGPNSRGVAAATIGVVALTGFLPFWPGYLAGVLAWFSAAYGWLGLPPARATLLVALLAAASFVGRLAVGGVMTAFVA